MKLTQEQQRVKELLSDTITRLCLSGFAFKTEFTIEALVGITLDNADVILFNINETVARTTLKTSQQPMCQMPPVCGTNLSVANSTSGESARCSVLNASSPPESVRIFPVQCTRASTSKINSKSVPIAVASTTPPIQSSKPSVGNVPTKTYVKILPKEVNTHEAPRAICNVPLIFAAPRRGRPKKNLNKQNIKPKIESRTIENSLASLPIASKSVDDSRTSGGSSNDVDDIPAFDDSPKRARVGVHVSDATSFVVKEEPIDNDDMDESRKLSGFTLADCAADSADRSCDADDLDAQTADDVGENELGTDGSYDEDDVDAQMPTDAGENELDEYVRDICVNEHRLSQSEVDESMQDYKEEFSRVDQEPDEETGARGGGFHANISKRSLAQIRRRQGLPYVNGKGEFVGGKEIKPQNCSRCKLRCAEKLSEADRRAIFAQFWQMGAQQVAFVKSFVREVPVQFLTLGYQSRRSRTLQYYLPAGHEKVKVCRDMFLNTLNLSVNTLYAKLAKV